MSVQIKWKNGAPPLREPAPANVPTAPSGSPTPESEPLPLGVVRVPAEPSPILPAKIAAFWFSEEADIPPWRFESVPERTRREFMERCGIWTG